MLDVQFQTKVTNDDIFRVTLFQFAVVLPYRSFRFLLLSVSFVGGDTGGRWLGWWCGNGVYRGSEQEREGRRQWWAEMGVASMVGKRRKVVIKDLGILFRIAGD